LSGNNPPGEHKTVELKIKQNDTAQLPDEAANYARAQLEALIAGLRTRRALSIAGSVDVDRPLRRL